jgi:predicted kinase
MAIDLLRVEPARLIAIGGFSGSGKSSAALSLAPAIGSVPGALVLRSDEIRKALWGFSPLERLGPAGYTHDTTTRVYRTLAERASAALEQGRTVIVDAVFARSGDREAIERIAAAASVPFAGLWMDAPPEVLLARIARRQLDASDADAAVVRQQLAAGTGLLKWRRIDAGRSESAVLADVRAELAAPPSHRSASATVG